ncbi:MAG: thiosulfate oxidation carrier protein SoxY [Hyphomicrobiales bacterium]|nr:thiosulfate oxidation carrier protein SoxY [Hyphomicrobiales bacterium]
MGDAIANSQTSRREVLGGGAALLVVGVGSASVPANAQSTLPAAEGLAPALARIAAGRPVGAGRVKVTLPELAENGNVVALSVDVQSPMIEADHVRAIHVLSEKNPITTVARFTLSPSAGRARVATNIRLADTQKVVALAEMSDGSLWSGEAQVVVTLAACIDGG